MNAFDVLQARGFVQQHTAGAPALLAGDPVAFYVGFDPTAGSLHVGHLLPVMAMAHLQAHGHRPIAILGGGTAMVGDPSGKDEMRQLITAETIEANKVGFRKQLGAVLDFSPGAGQLVDNADWLLGLNYIEFLRDVGRHFSVNTMLSKASVKMRLERGLSFLEFNYQLLQAYDFLELYRRHGCVLQMGGDDQWGNITAGIDLIRRVTGAEAHGMTFPLLTTSTGKKMGKTAKGAVWLDAELLSPFDYYQYWVNVDDADVVRLLKLFTFLPLDRIDALAALTGPDIRQAKAVLAFEATKVVHGEDAAIGARAGAKAAFSGGAAQAEVPTLETALPRSVIDLLVEARLCASKSDARRQIQGNAIRLGDTKVTAIDAQVGPGDLSDGAVMLWRGKKKSVRVVQA